MKPIWHLFYKEWIKTRAAFFGTLIVGIGVVFYLFIGVENRITLMGAKGYTLYMLYNNPPVIYYGLLRYIPLLAAVCIGASQYAPEVAQRRIRLTLHLPVGSTAVVYTMVLYGLAVFCCTLLPALLITTATLAACFPAEVVVATLQTLLPWLLGGMTAYFFTAMIAFEPVWKFRFGYILIAYFTLRFFYLGYGVGNAVTAYPLLLVITLVSSLAVIYTSHRFNKGEL